MMKRQGSAYDSPKRISFLITNLLYTCPKDLRVTQPLSKSLAAIYTLYQLHHHVCTDNFCWNFKIWNKHWIAATLKINVVTLKYFELVLINPIFHEDISYCKMYAVCYECCRRHLQICSLHTNLGLALSTSTAAKVRCHDKLNGAVFTSDGVSSLPVLDT